MFLCISLYFYSLTPSCKTRVAYEKKSSMPIQAFPLDLGPMGKGTISLVRSIRATFADRDFCFAFMSFYYHGHIPFWCLEPFERTVWTSMPSSKLSTIAICGSTNAPHCLYPRLFWSSKLPDMLQANSRLPHKTGQLRHCAVFCPSRAVQMKFPCLQLPLQSPRLPSKGRPQLQLQTCRGFMLN